MKKFITFEEKILKSTSLDDYLEFLIKNNVSGLEVAMHKKLLDFEIYKELAKKSKSLNMDINFHIPDFVVEGEFEIADFKGSSSIKKNFLSYYEDIERLFEYADISGEATITFHGAGVNENKYDRALVDTMYFSDYSLNYFEKNRLPFILSCETLNSKNMVFGDSREDLMKLVLEFKSRLLGICWDIVHDRSNYSDDYVMPDEPFFTYINNVHIHGVKKQKEENLDHLPLYMSELILDDYISYLKERKYDKFLTHELLGFRTKDYKSDLEKDLEIINSYLI